MEKILKRQVLALAAGVITATAFSITVFAGSAGASISTSDKSASTAVLGNTTGTYRYVVSNGTTSKYSIEGYLYKGKTDASINTQAKKVTIGIGDVYADNITVNKDTYTVAQAKIYGNAKSNKKTGCIAATIISNK